MLAADRNKVIYKSVSLGGVETANKSKQVKVCVYNVYVEHEKKNNMPKCFV